MMFFCPHFGLFKVAKKGFGLSNNALFLES
uniref:Uncharacterized protein n=1 Tax=Rhizophora mucronata TaxID=61149 RepID=A0A2P2QK64_RHIMU